MKELHDIQQALKAPKNQHNSFGNYKYRSCEDILEGVKKVLPDSAALIITDDIQLIGDRHYVKATARLVIGEQCIESHGWAREPLAKKGMDDSQLTGATSSYARKYALNGLFCIDDTKDADTQDNSKEKNWKEVSNALYNSLNDCLEMGQFVAWQEENEKAISELPETFEITTRQWVEQRAAQLESGNVERWGYAFNGVSEAWEWFQKHAGKLTEIKTLEDLTAWHHDNLHVINSLDILKAKKYCNGSGKPPKQRIEEKVKDLMTQYSQQPQQEAAE